MKPGLDEQFDEACMVAAIVSAITREANSARTLEELRAVQSKSNAMFTEMNRLLWNREGRAA